MKAKKTFTKKIWAIWPVHERNIIFMEHCREAALYVGKRCGWEIVNCSDNGQPRSIDEIQDEICKITQKTIQENTNA